MQGSMVSPFTSSKACFPRKCSYSKAQIALQNGMHLASTDAMPCRIVTAWTLEYEMDKNLRSSNFAGCSWSPTGKQAHGDSRLFQQLASLTWNLAC